MKVSFPNMNIAHYLEYVAKGMVHFYQKGYIAEEE
jgi:hypothetical protein